MPENKCSIVGDLINFRGLVYAPLNENGVVFLFGKIAEDLNMYVEEIKPGFPDCIARRFTGKGWERVRVEFEYRSSSFKRHGHNPEECDLIICWEHDWNKCPIEVIELKDRIKELENRPIKRPEEGGASEEAIANIDEWFDKYGTKEVPRQLFQELIDFVKSIDEECFFKVGSRIVSIYCPERMFIFLYPRKSMLRLVFFTNGEPLGEVKQFEFERGAEKWGGISIASREELLKARPWVEESYRRIKSAIQENRPTGWWARSDVDSEEEIQS